MHKTSYFFNLTRPKSFIVSQIQFERWEWERKRKFPQKKPATLLFTPFCRFGMCVMYKIQCSELNGAVKPLIERREINIIGDEWAVIKIVCESNRFQDIIIAAFKWEITLKSENQPKKRNSRYGRGYTHTRTHSGKLEKRVSSIHLKQDEKSELLIGQSYERVEMNANSLEIVLLFFEFSLALSFEFLFFFSLLLVQELVGLFEWSIHLFLILEMCAVALSQYVSAKHFCVHFLTLFSRLRKTIDLFRLFR